MNCIQAISLDRRRVGNSCNLRPFYSKNNTFNTSSTLTSRALSSPVVSQSRHSASKMQEKSHHRVTVQRVTNAIRGIPTSVGIIIGIILGVLVSQLLSKGVRLVCHSGLSSFRKRVTRAVRGATRVNSIMLPGITGLFQIEIYASTEMPSSLGDLPNSSSIHTRYISL